VNNQLGNNWIDFFLIAIFVINFLGGVKNGSATLFFSRFKKTEDPLPFWAAMILSGIGAVILLINVLYSIFLG
jgi:hypothetical protein